MKRADGNNAPRVKITISTTAEEGNVQLTRSSEKVRIFTAATGGAELTFLAGSESFPVANLPKDLWVEGATESDSMRDVLLQVTHDIYTPILDRARFTVLWATVTARHAGVASADNSAATIFAALPVPFDQTARLGYALRCSGLVQMVDPTTDPLAWDGIGTEFIGTILPSDFVPAEFGGTLRLYRELVDGKEWSGMAGDGTDNVNNVATIPDFQQGNLLHDFDPQSGGSQGKIYDGDAPGHVRNLALGAQGFVFRLRYNFSEWGEWTPAGGQPIRISEKKAWYTRQSYERGAAATFKVARVAGATANTVTSQTGGWAANEFQDGLVLVSNGAGKDQIRGIDTNTADTLTIIGTWTVAPGNGDFILIERASRWVRRNDVMGDNTSADGTTKLSWDLQ